VDTALDLEEGLMLLQRRLGGGDVGDR
jgi:hypothetical protein